MQKCVSLAVLLPLLLAGCTLPDDDGIPRIRSQRDVAAYNATVSDPRQQLICTREVVVGSNFRQYICLTVAQWERREQDDKQQVNDVFSRVGTGPAAADQ